MDNLIGIRIRERRKELKLTQVQVKELCGVSNGNLSDFENGNKIPSAAALIALSNALQVSTDWILTGKNHYGDISSVILSPLDREALSLFRKLSRADQNEILELMEFKTKRKIGQEKSSISQADQQTETA